MGFLSNVQIYTDSGKFHLKADQLSDCTSGRATIDLDAAGTFDKSLYAQILAYYIAKKPMKIVVDLAASPCVLKGARDFN